MIIQLKDINGYIKDTDKMIGNSNYYGNRIITKSFLYSLREFIKMLSETNSLIIKEKSILEVTFDSDYYKEMIGSLSDSLSIKIRLAKKIFNLSRLEKIKKSLSINTFEFQLDYSKAIDMRLGLILIIFNYYLLSYQINNKTLEYCNQSALINLIDTLDKYLSGDTLFPVSIPNRIKKSFSDSIEFKALLVQNRNILNKKEN